MCAFIAFQPIYRYVDMLLVLLNFPTSMGKVSKPNGGKGPQQGDWTNTEPFVFPFWCVGLEGVSLLPISPLCLSVLLPNPCCLLPCNLWGA